MEIFKNINNNEIPRPEYPRPQFQRNNWMNLNGIWEFEFDQNNSGIEKGYYKEGAFFHRK